MFHGASDLAQLADWIEQLAAQGAAYAARRVARDLAEGLLLTFAFQL